MRERHESEDCGSEEKIEEFRGGMVKAVSGENKKQRSDVLIVAQEPILGRLTGKIETNFTFSRKETFK